jgi:hypothetical protein
MSRNVRLICRRLFYFCICQKLLEEQKRRKVSEAKAHAEEQKLLIENRKRKTAEEKVRIILIALVIAVERPKQIYKCVCPVLITTPFQTGERKRT